ncbi:MAG: DUF4384 domain-containing protein [Granulosicoccus sp.]
MRIFNKISICCFAIGTAISGCTANPVASLDMTVGVDLASAIERAKNTGNNEGLIALDLVSALVQFKEVDPSRVNLQLAERTSSFALQVEDALNYAGYNQRPAADSMKTLIVVTTVGPDSDLMSVSSVEPARTYQIKVANIIVKRDYHIHEGQLEPKSRIHLSGADAIRVNRDNGVFDGMPNDIAPAGFIDADNALTKQPRTALNLGAHTLQETSLSSYPGLGAEVLEKNDTVSSAESWSNINKSSQLNLLAHTQNGLRISEGDLIQLSVNAGKDSQLHCYYQDGDGQVARIFPNRYTSDPVVRASESLTLPQSESWQLLATVSGKSENFMCIAIDPQWSERLHVITLLPDLQPLAVTDLSEIYDRYKDAIGYDLVNESVSVVVY